MLFVENAEKEIAVLYKGKKFFHANSAGRTGKFLDYLYKKAGGNSAKLEEEMSRLVGMAENIAVPDITVEKFEAGWKALQEAKITAENAMDFFEEAKIYFNHKAIINAEGKKVVVQIADHNCVEVAKVVDEFFKTGKINNAAFSVAQDMWVDLSVWFQNKYGLPSGLKYLDNVGLLHTRMTDNETGILLCMRGGGDEHHVINVIKRSNSKRAEFIDLQDIKGNINLKKGVEFIGFKYMKTN